MHRPTQALRRGYAVLALTAKNERSQCWSSGGAWQTNDHSQVGQGSCVAPHGVGQGRPACLLLVSSNGDPPTPTPGPNTMLPSLTTPILPPHLPPSRP